VRAFVRQLGRAEFLVISFFRSNYVVLVGGDAQLRMDTLQAGRP
jgi:hypothetical protein